MSGGPTSFTVAVATGTGSGTLRLDIPGTASITDGVSNLLASLPYENGEIYTIDRTAPVVLSILSADPSPTNAEIVHYTVTFSEAVTGVDVSDFSLTVTGLLSAYVTDVSGGPTLYTVIVDTGRRNGTLRLDVPTTASITDAVGNGLSGLPYTGGESYTLDRDEPVIVTILRVDPSPTNAGGVNYTVTFSEAVSEVSPSDFSLALSGITGAVVSEVSGGPVIYTVAVLTGVGDGTLRLDIPDTAEITDLAGNELSGLPYTIGELYTLDRTAPSLLSILRADPDPTNLVSVDFTITFSEAVTGLEDGDFMLTLSGITGATVSQVSQYLKTYARDSENKPLTTTNGNYLVTSTNTALKPAGPGMVRKTAFSAVRTPRMATSLLVICWPVRLAKMAPRHSPISRMVSSGTTIVTPLPALMAVTDPVTNPIPMRIA